MFEEHGYPGDPLYPMFYHKQIWTASGPDVIVKPNFCSNVEPVGSLQTGEGGECGTDPVSGLPAADCVFLARQTEGLTSSIMALPYLPGNNHWCDSTEEHVHDDELPNKHNTMCSGQNVFQVVRKHEDFLEFQPGTEDVNTIPTFTLLRPEDAAGSFVFVLDNSGSMYEATERSQRMRHGVERFMLFDVDLTKQFSVGVVKFSDDATIIHDVEAIDNENVRDEIIDAVNGLTKDGGTCLGYGIFRGLEALQQSGLDHGGSAIFLTDGEQSCGGADNSTIQEALASVVGQGVRVCTVAFGAEADPDLEELAARTGGAGRVCIVISHNILSDIFQHSLYRTTADQVSQSSLLSSPCKLSSDQPTSTTLWPAAWSSSRQYRQDRKNSPSCRNRLKIRRKLIRS